jgi:pilus assembly protein CpaE
VVASSDEFERDQIVHALSQQENVQIIGVAHDGLEASQMAVQFRPDAVVMDTDLEEMDGLSAAAAIWLAAPQVATLLVSEEPDTVWRQAMRAGVNDILSKPVIPAELLEALQAIDQTRSKRHTREFRALLDPQLMPRVIATSGAKGGVGKTTVATNLAVALARKHRGEAVLVDLYSQFGDVALVLGLRPKRTLMDMVPLEGEIDQELVEAHLIPHKSGLKVLVGTNSPTDLDALTVTCLSAVLSNLKRRYRYVVLDVPAVLYDATRFVLRHATAVVLVANLFDLTTLHDTRKLYQLLVRDTVPRERIHLVLNRIARHNRLRATEIERAIGRPATACIPNAAGLVVNSINEGVPFVMSHPQAPVSRSIWDLAQEVIKISSNGAPTPRGDSASTAQQAAKSEDNKETSDARSG